MEPKLQNSSSNVSLRHSEPAIMSSRKHSKSLLNYSPRTGFAPFQTMTGFSRVSGSCRCARKGTKTRVGASPPASRCLTSDNMAWVL